MKHQRATVLAIDDQKDNLIVIEALLQEALPQVRFHAATSAKQGLKLARSVHPDVILLDIVMPEMDGLSACRKLKSDPELAEIPVLFVTALQTTREQRLQALQSGAEGFLEKPIDEIDLMAQVLTMARIKEASLQKKHQQEQLQKLVQQRTQKLQLEVEERKRIEKALRESEKRYRIMFEHSPVGVCITESQSGKIVECNARHDQITGWPLKLNPGLAWMDYTHPEDLSRDLEQMELLNEGRIQVFNLEKRYVRPDGSVVWARIHVTRLPLDDQDQQYHLGLVEDISERKNREAKIEYLNQHDLLTGLYNRSFFQAECHRLDVPRQLPLSIIVGDIDGLKLINDAFGPKEGDRLLCETASILRSSFRQDDIIARTGDDDFSVLLPQTTRETAAKLMHRVQEACRLYEPQKKSAAYRLSLSLGYATKTSAEESLDQKIKEAESYLLRRKLLERRSLHHSLLASIRATMMEKSSETREHGDRMALMAHAIGEDMGLSESQQQDLKLLAHLHDIGKIVISDAVLNKPGKLSQAEWQLMKKHPEVGYRIAQSSPEIRHIAQSIRCHHERWDGKGYPRGVKGENIPVISRILAVVDAYDAMTHDRVYRKALSHQQAIDEIHSESGKQFDPRVAEIFIARFSEAAKLASIEEQAQKQDDSWFEKTSQSP